MPAAGRARLALAAGAASLVFALVARATQGASPVGDAELGRAA